MRAISYALQERELGGLPASLRRALLAIATGNPASLPRLKIKRGTRLLREWRGTTHEVIVTDQGFVWEGATYGSLSAVAVASTGAARLLDDIRAKRVDVIIVYKVDRLTPWARANALTK